MTILLFAMLNPRKSKDKEQSPLLVRIASPNDSTPLFIGDGFHGSRHST
jgi:hypothetical protein